jgi:predicted TIM-barrel fold metal-dependent hydrolase
MLERALTHEQVPNLYFDISWDETAKYVVSSPEAVRLTADLINRFPDRFLFGTDAVAPKDQESYLAVYYQYEPLWQALSSEAREMVKKGNYERLFDRARARVRAWEKANVEP